jgi:hypothetical protein
MCDITYMNITLGGNMIVYDFYQSLTFVICG